MNFYLFCSTCPRINLFVQSKRGAYKSSLYYFCNSSVPLEVLNDVLTSPPVMLLQGSIIVLLDDDNSHRLRKTLLPCAHHITTSHFILTTIQCGNYSCPYFTDEKNGGLERLNNRLHQMPA